MIDLPFKIAQLKSVIFLKMTSNFPKLQFTFFESQVQTRIPRVVALEVEISSFHLSSHPTPGLRMPTSR